MNSLPLNLQHEARDTHVSLSKDHNGDRDEKPIPDRRDKRRFSHAGLPEPPSYNEADMSDKPPFLQAAPRVGPRNEARLTAKWRWSLDSLVGVDRYVGKVVKAV